MLPCGRRFIDCFSSAGWRCRVASDVVGGCSPAGDGNSEPFGPRSSMQCNPRACRNGQAGRNRQHSQAWRRLPWRCRRMTARFRTERASERVRGTSAVAPGIVGQSKSAGRGISVDQQLLPRRRRSARSPGGHSAMSSGTRAADCEAWSGSIRVRNQRHVGKAIRKTQTASRQQLQDTRKAELVRPKAC